MTTPNSGNVPSIIMGGGVPTGDLIKKFRQFGVVVIPTRCTEAISLKSTAGSYMGGLVPELKVAVNRDPRTLRKNSESYLKNVSFGDDSSHSRKP